MKASIKINFFTVAILISFLIFPGLLAAQTTHDVAVSNNIFEPANLTIAVGDEVKWTNNEGTHSVNGTQTTYPNNPVAFSNSTGGPGWTFTFTFSTAGVYDYECGVHGKSMVGKITVGSATGIEDNSQVSVPLNAFPNPANGILNIPAPEKLHMENTAKTLKIYNLSGAMLSQQQVSVDKTIQTDIKALAKGIYFYVLSSKNQVIASGKFIKQE